MQWRVGRSGCRPSLDNCKNFDDVLKGKFFATKKIVKSAKSRESRTRDESMSRLPESSSIIQKPDKRKRKSGKQKRQSDKVHEISDEEFPALGGNKAPGSSKLTNIPDKPGLN